MRLDLAFLDVPKSNRKLCVEIEPRVELIQHVDIDERNIILSVFIPYLLHLKV